MNEQTSNLSRIISLEELIHQIRGQRVMLDEDLARLYEVETRTLIQAVKRKKDRFPEDFMFQLTKEEFANLRSQIVISRFWGGRRSSPYAFTEQGVAMLSGVLNSDEAARVNVEIMRAFVKMRRVFASHKELALKLDELEQAVEVHDQKIDTILDAIRQMMSPPESSKPRIGFHTGCEQTS